MDFFDAPVPAAEARALGFALLDKAMEAYPQLDFASYDRLFPNQDTMPAGGLGNLIALPLQKARRAEGCSVFVDRQFMPNPAPATNANRSQIKHLPDLAFVVLDH